MGLFSNAPKKMLGIFFLENEFVAGTVDLPKTGMPKGERINIIVYPFNTPDGDFTRSGNRILTINTSFLYEHAGGSCTGVPKTSLLIYKHPSNPLIAHEDQFLATENARLNEMLKQQEKNLAILSRRAELAIAEPEKAAIRAGAAIGEASRKARSYPQQQGAVIDIRARRPPQDDEDDKI